MSELKWTRDKPTVPGLYMARPDYGIYTAVRIEIAEKSGTGVWGYPFLKGHVVPYKPPFDEPRMVRETLNGILRRSTWWLGPLPETGERNPPEKGHVWCERCGESTPKNERKECGKCEQEICRACHGDSGTWDCEPCIKGVKQYDG